MPAPVSTKTHSHASSTRDDSGPIKDDVDRKDSPLEDRALTMRTKVPPKPAPSKGKRGEARYDRPPTPRKERSTATPARLLPEETPSTQGPTSTINTTDLIPGSLAHLTPGLGLHWDLTESLWPFNTDDQLHQDFVSYDLSAGFQSTPAPDDPDLDPALLSDMGSNNSPIDLPLIVQDPSPLDGPSFIAADGHLTPPDSMEANSPLAAIRERESLGYIYPQPFYAEDSQEMLTFRFDKLTCGILSVMDGPTENPWRNLIWPLAQQSPALYHAITAMAAFHSVADVPQNRIVGIQHKAASLRYISEGIRDGSFSTHTAIATALVLGFTEAWEHPTVTGNTHIKGAQVLVAQAIEAHQENPVEGVELARLKFLCNAWVYMDVIARLTSFDSDESQDFDNTFLFDGPHLIMGKNDPGFGIDFGMPVDTRLDPLMGCASTLFPLIGRVANLVRRVCRSRVNSAALIEKASDLKRALEKWDPPAYIERPEDPTTEVEHTLQTAEAYRWATLLHLHSAVPEMPFMSSADLAQHVLRYLATVPLASRTVIVQIYPLMVAGCEAKTEEDRQWVRNRWAAMNARMRIGIVDKALQVTEEVWRRRDVYEAQPFLSRRLIATSELNPVRGRSQALVRSPGGRLVMGDPGYTGMVWSYLDADDPRVTEEEMQRRGRERISCRDPHSEIDRAYTARGHLHWIGVMWDWGWEGAYNLFVRRMVLT